MGHQHHLRPYSSSSSSSSFNSSPSSSSSSSSSLELPYSSSTMCRMKTLVHAYVFRHVCHLFRALVNAKASVPELLQRISMAMNHCALLHRLTMIRLHHKKKKLLTTIKLHLNWRRPSSSYVMPAVLQHSLFESFHAYGHVYYDPTWNSVICTDDTTTGAAAASADEDDSNGDREAELPLSGYLNWLEERNDHEGLPRGGEEEEEEDGESEIDRLAEKFIERCHEKFRLEKQESYRRYQEMLATRGGI